MTQKDPLEIQEQAQAAQRTLDDPIFKQVHFNLRKKCFNALLQAPVGSLTAQQQHAMLLALEDVVAELQSFITEDKMQQRKR